MREIAKDTGNLVWTDHIRDRMLERGIDADAVLRILRTGDVEIEPEPAKVSGDWSIKITRMLAVGRVAGVVTVLASKGKLILITTEWEDHR